MKKIIPLTLATPQIYMNYPIMGEVGKKDFNPLNNSKLISIK